MSYSSVRSFQNDSITRNELTVNFLKFTVEKPCSLGNLTKFSVDRYTLTVNLNEFSVVWFGLTVNFIKFTVDDR